MPQNGRKNMFRDKQTTKKVALMFSDAKVLQKGNSCVFELCQQTRKLQCLTVEIAHLEAKKQKQRTA